MGVDESTYLPMLSVAQRPGDSNPNPNPYPNPDPDPNPTPTPNPNPSPDPDPDPDPNQVAQRRGDWREAIELLVHAKEIKCETGERSYNLTLTACANAREERACR